MGYWGDNVIAGVPKLEWPDRVNPIPIPLDNAQIYSETRDGKTYKASAVIESANILKIRWDKQIKLIGPNSGLKPNKMLKFKVGQRDERSIDSSRADLSIESSKEDRGIEHITVLTWPNQEEIFQTEYKLGTEPDKAYRVTIPKYFIQDYADNLGETDKDKNNQNYEIENMEVLNKLPVRSQIVSAEIDFDSRANNKKEGTLIIRVDKAGLEQIPGSTLLDFISITISGSNIPTNFQERFRHAVTNSVAYNLDPDKRISIKIVSLDKDLSDSDIVVLNVKSGIFRDKTTFVSNQEALDISVDMSSFS